MRADLASNSFNQDLSETGETKEDIPVIINPYGVFQYVSGVVYGAIANSDRPADYNMATHVIVSYVGALNSLADLDNVNVLPRALLELGYSLRARTVGKYRYIPVWTPLNYCVTGMLYPQTNNLMFCGYDKRVYNANVPPPPGGFLISDAPKVWPNDQLIMDWQSLHAGSLDLVPVIEGYKLDNGDASAFAWDTAGAQSFSPYLGDFFSIYSINNAQYKFVYANSSVGLETYIGKPHLAKLRLGTIGEGYGDQTTQWYYAPPSTGSPRVARFSIPVQSLPSTIGYSMSFKGKLGHDPQLKLVPLHRLIAGVIARYEYFGDPSRLGSSWTSALGPNDLVVFSYILIKHMYRKYSGIEVGVWTQNRNTSSTQIFTELEPYRVHFDDSVIESVKVPEPIMRYISSQLAYMDCDGSIFPAAQIQTYDIATKYTYQGTSVYPTIPTDLWDQRAPVYASDLMIKMKGLESLMAQYCNLCPPTVVGGSNLDTTLYLDQNENILSVWSRRPLGDVHFSQVMSNCGAISYQYQAINASIVNGGGTNMGAFGNHLFRQRVRKDLSGYQSLSEMIQASVSNGFVTKGTYTSNIQGNTGPNSLPSRIPYPKFRTLDTPARYAQHVPKLVIKMIGDARLTHPIDCAHEVGSRDKPVEIIDGKCAAAPTDAENKIRRTYHKMSCDLTGNAIAMGKLETRVLLELDELRHTEGLSLYGHCFKSALESRSYQRTCSSVNRKH